MPVTPSLNDDTESTPPSDREKWEFERWKAREDVRLRELELKTKEREVRRQHWLIPVIIAILAASGTAIAGYVTSYFTSAGNQALEERKAAFEDRRAESERLMAMLKVDQRAARNNLEFMIAAKLLRDDNVINAVRHYLEKNATADFPTLIPESGSAPFCDSAGSPLPEAVPRRHGDLLNLALIQEATANASSVYPDPLRARHSIEYLRDGWYNNCRSWVSAEPTAWVEIDLKKDYLVSLVVFGSEHTPFYRDRAITKFTLLGSTSASPDTWIPLKQYDGPDPISDRKEFPIQEQPLRRIRIDIKASVRGAPRIDEIEIYGRPP